MMGVVYVVAVALLFQSAVALAQTPDVLGRNYYTGPEIHMGNVTYGGLTASRTTPNVAAAGTSLSTATLLTSQINFVTSVASGTGVSLPAAPVGSPILIRNAGANTLNVFPNSVTDQIESLSAGSATTLAAGVTGVFERDVANHWYRVQ
ncbi:hypothetical protein NFI95_15475 [Acetobacteraceae bacterium KSS8]|uniref:SH3 domain-containing protein n=1 Tax=Endosaccharibacter trunci TaxID=2812733 RepID=A0ABT1WAD1_9PROT|nr:hypothetical protein [Acetobacteraceae bacterium KSS8]